MRTRTHAARRHEFPHRRVLSRTNDLFALVVRPETTQAVAHLAEPRARNAVEETADACRVVRFLYRVDHALVAGGLQAHFRQVERAV